MSNTRVNFFMDTDLVDTVDNFAKVYSMSRGSAIAVFVTLGFHVFLYGTFDFSVEECAPPPTRNGGESKDLH